MTYTSYMTLAPELTDEEKQIVEELGAEKAPQPNQGSQEEETTTEENGSAEAQEADKQPEGVQDPDGKKADEWTKETSKPVGGYAKLLKQRNEARHDLELSQQEIAGKTTTIASLEKELAELKWKEDVTQDALIEKSSELSVAKVDLSNAKKTQEKDFYKSVPDAVQFKEEIDKTLQAYPNMNVYDAALFVAAKNGAVAEKAQPAAEVVVDPQKENQTRQSDVLWRPWSSSPASGNRGNLSTADMEKELQKEFNAWVLDF